MKKTFFMCAFLPAVLGGAVETDMPPGADMMIVSEDGKTRSSIYFAKERSRPTASRRKILTDSGHYFKYPPAQIIDPRPVADRLDGICRSMEYYEKAVEQLLNRETVVCNSPGGTREWGVLYANLPLLTGNKVFLDTNTVKYAFSLLCARRYEQAERILLPLVEKTPDDYGATILLGWLSIRNEKYFPYLEKAFAVNPTKTLNMVEWQSQNLDMLYRMPQEWDFIGAYLPLVLRYWDGIDIENVSSVAAGRLSDAVSERYFDEKYDVLPEYQDQVGEWKKLRSVLMKHAIPSSASMMRKEGKTFRVIYPAREDNAGQ